MAELKVRELQKSDISLIADYWQNADESFLRNMGADKSLLPKRHEWEERLFEQISQPYEEKNSYCIIGVIDETPIGHCNVNKIDFGNEAFMHLHLWYNDKRGKGMGTEMVRKSIPYFFEYLQLQHLYCEPYALNEAPNKTLAKAGFDFIKEYITIPGPLNFEQPVKQWHLSLDKFHQINNKEL